MVLGGPGGRLCALGKASKLEVMGGMFLVVLTYVSWISWRGLFQLIGLIYLCSASSV
jgi:hypothetical protein